jgi:hypothetical protein
MLLSMTETLCQPKSRASKAMARNVTSMEGAWRLSSMGWGKSVVSGRVRAAGMRGWFGGEFSGAQVNARRQCRRVIRIRQTCTTTCVQRECCRVIDVMVREFRPAARWLSVVSWPLWSRHRSANVALLIILSLHFAFRFPSTKFPPSVL